jgi:hypothetical protein
MHGCFVGRYTIIYCQFVFPSCVTFGSKLTIAVKPDCLNLAMHKLNAI